MRTALTAFIMVAAILFPHAARAHQAKSPVPAYGCDGAPADAVLALPVPAGYWMRIVCTDKGHTLAPIPGDAWQIVQDSRPPTISATPKEGAMRGRHSSYFVAAVVERLSRASAAPVAEIYGYWNRKRSERPMPRRVDIDPAEITRHLPGIQLIDVKRDPLDFVYRLVGAREVAARGHDPTGRRVAERFFGQNAAMLWRTTAGCSQRDRSSMTSTNSRR